jgi:hypothetical protein
MNSPTVMVLGAAMLAVCIDIREAAAITAGDVMDKMEPKERASFISGAVDMASHLYAIAGNRTKADCAVKWLFETEGSNREIDTFLGAHKDKDAVGLLSILIDRKCGK